jgi:prepilin-type N-terminal cleavage/methylation domain-containing protein
VNHDRSGFTLVEVMIAIVVLGVGVIALAGSSASVTRMIGRGKHETRAAQVASRRIEALRAAALSSTPRCTAGAFASGGPLAPEPGVSETWVVPGAGTLRTITVTVTHRMARGSHTDVLTTTLEC